MKNEITTKQTFEEKLSERIKKDIGDLIPDEDLQEVVKKAMDKAFFHEKINYDNYNREKSREMPWIVNHVKSLTEERIDAAIKKWIAENDKAVNEMVKGIIEEGITKVCLQSLTTLFQPDMQQLGYSVETKLQELRRNNMI